MNISEVVITVVGSLIAYIVATLLITSLITGTSAGDTLNKIGASKSNLGMKTPLIRGKLNPFGHANPDLAEGNISPWARVEALHGVPLWGKEKVHSFMKIEGKVYPEYCADCGSLRGSRGDPEKVLGLVVIT